MRWRCPIPAVALAVCLHSALLPAYSEQNRANPRDRRILEIQQRIEEQDLAGAMGLLREAAKSFPGDAGLENLRGVIAAQQGDYLAAETSFNRAIEGSPKFTAAYLNLGRLYQERSATDPQARRRALDLYARVLAYEPGNPEANYQSAALLLEHGEYRDSRQRLSRLTGESRDSAQAWSILCADDAGLGDRKGADDAARSLLAQPDFSEVDVRQMLPALKAGRRDDLAVSVLESLEQRQSLPPEMLHALGLSYERTQRLVEARDTLEKYFSTANHSVVALVELARVAHTQQDYQGSLGYLAHARDLDPGNASLYYYFGLVCLDLNLIAEARNAFDKAVKLEPENPSYNYAMGAASAFRHDPAEAVPYFEKYLKLKPQDPRARLALGAALFRAKDYAAARRWLVDAARVPETAVAAHYYLGSMALAEHRFEEARNQLGQALRAQPDYPNALAELGQYYLMQKDYSQAEKQLRHALELDPDHFSANFYLLTLYTRTGDARREAQAARFEELQKLRDEKTRELLRMVEVRPFETP
jgi:tetratricopeptide (TPR) repeat protein